MARQLTHKILLLATVLLAVLAVPPLGPLRAARASATSVPRGLPARIGIGLSGGPQTDGIYGWMPNSGVPWDYAYQYLAGGTNTGGGWETWNAGAQFPLYYAQGAASHGYIPVFSYYELLQSAGSCGSCGESQKDLSNLNNAATMASYFQNFALLMKRLGSGTYDGVAGFGKTAIVHVEPDLSGYAEQAVLDNAKCSGYCTGQGNDPALLKAAVGSSGYGDAAAYPDTYQGFNQALLHLRDLYAPNVLLAFHVSNWATTKDVGSADPSLNATALGQQAGQFAARSGAGTPAAGASSYDLLFNDVADHDAGYYKYVWGSANAFWDAHNIALPNFHRWEDYIAAASLTTGRRVMVWQIPLGNQYFDTENNTDGHYQDNRAEYFFGHMDELARAGIAGLLFGAGNGGSTVNTDGKRDGVTNPSSFCTSDGVSGAQACNTHTSTVADDDGGYLRMAAGQYYASGAYALNDSTTTTPMATPAPPMATPAPPTATMPADPSFTFNGTTESGSSVAPGSTQIFTTTITTNKATANRLIDVEVHDAADRTVWQTWRSPVSFTAGAPQTFTFAWQAPSTTPAGAYTLKIGIFPSDWSRLQAWNNNAIAFTVAANAPSSTSTVSATNTATVTPAPTSTATAPSTDTSTVTPRPTSTATLTPRPTSTATLANTSTATAIPPTATAIPRTATSTNTATARPTATNTATSTATSIPPTSASTATATSANTATATSANTATATSASTATATSANTATATSANTATARPTATNTATSTATSIPPVSAPPAAPPGPPPTATPPAIPPPSPPVTVAPDAPLRFAVTNAAEGRQTVAPGTWQTFDVTLASNRAAANEVVDFETHDPADAKVWQTWRGPVSFAAGRARRFSVSWRVPATARPGRYTFKVGVFSGDWSRLQAWNNSVITCVVSPPSAMEPGAARGAVAGARIGPHIVSGRATTTTRGKGGGQRGVSARHRGRAAHKARATRRGANRRVHR